MAIRQYRREDQFYYDEYDRFTIEELKVLETAAGENLFSPEIRSQFLIIEKHYNPFTSFYETGVGRARSREGAVRQMMRDDEKQDYLVRNTPIPENISCEICGHKLVLSAHLFFVKEYPIIFAFDCLSEHKVRKLVLPSGHTFHYPFRKCDQCGDHLTKETAEITKKLICTDTCDKCGKVSVIELELPPKDQPIDETDRQKYCKDFVGKSTFWDDMESLKNYGAYISERKKKLPKVDLSQIKILTVAAVEKHLSEKLKALGFNKFQFDKTEIKQGVIVSFSAQDTCERTSAESIKVFVKNLRAELFNTNWRVMGTYNQELHCQLGFLTGRLKGVEDTEDLTKIAKEIESRKGGSSAEKEK